MGVRDDFLDAQLFIVEVMNSTEVDDESADLWIMEMIVFLSIGWLLETVHIQMKHMIDIRWMDCGYGRCMINL